MKELYHKLNTMREDYPEKCNNCSYWSKCLQKYEISEYEECRDYQNAIASYSLGIILCLSAFIVYDESNSEQDEESDLSWVRFVATDEDGDIYAYSEEPIKVEGGWWPNDGYYKVITKEEAMNLCGKIPAWTNAEPTPVK